MNKLVRLRTCSRETLTQGPLHLSSRTGWG